MTFLPLPSKLVATLYTFEIQETEGLKDALKKEIRKFKVSFVSLLS
jgi:hypothetical protein